jgi:tetratricopeptide (TPR) repeat protein
MDAGRRAYEKGQYDKAIKEYLKIVKEDPKDVRVWLKIGDLYAKKNAKGEATETYMKVAKFYSEQGFYLKAVAVYKQILKVDPRLVEVNLKLAELYRQLGLLSDAMQHFEMVAAFFHREGKTKEALATLRQLVDLDPENVATRIKLAELYSKEEMAEEAITEFRTTCEFLRKNGRQDDFIKVAERLVFHDADNTEMCRELATLYLQRNDPRRALAKLQICFKADQSDATVLALLAQAFQRLDQKGKTVSVLKELARVHTESGKRKEAEEVHEKILLYVPNDPDSLQFLGKTARPSALAENVQIDVPEQIPEIPPRFGGNDTGRSTGSMPLVQPPADEGSFGESSVGDSRPPEDDFVAELELDEQAGYEQKEHSAVVAQQSADEIVKILTETDVYVKYGLNQKAIDHLRKVFDLDERNIEARERLQDILIKEGREDEGLRELLVLADHTVIGNPEQALGYIRQMLAIDGGNRDALDFAERHRLEVVSGLGGAGVDPAGHLAMPEGQPQAGGYDELDFDDLPPEGQGRPGEGLQTRRAGQGFVNDGSDPNRPPTVEVDVGQVEGAVAVAEFDSDELDFDAMPPGDPLAGPREPLSEPPPGMAPEFNSADAAAFDAQAGYDQNSQYADDEIHDLDEIDMLDGDDIEEIDSAELMLPDATEASLELPLGEPRQPTASSGLEDDLDEAEFFLAQGLIDEARSIVEILTATHPTNPLVTAKMDEINRAALGEPAPSIIDDEFDSDDLGDALGDALDGALDGMEDGSPAVVLENPVADDDSETHFDLGQAYKEMGIYGEAIIAFEKVLNSPGKEVQCRLMIGLCHREQGSLSEAISQFKAGLYVNGISGSEKFGLYYEIGQTYEGLQDPQEALYYYEMVLKKESAYRDVAARVAAIKGAASQSAG